MADQFVSTPVPTDLTKTGASSAGEPTLNTSALREAGKNLLNNGTQPNSAPSGQPSGHVPDPVSPVQQIPVRVTEAPAPQQQLESQPGDDGQQKVTTTDPNTGQKTEINLADIPDDAIVRMKVNGEVVAVSGKEAREFGMRGAKFTREMQQLRQREEQFGERLTRAEQLEQLVGDDVNLARYIYQTKPHIVEALAQEMGLTRQQAAEAIAANPQAAAAVSAQPDFVPRVEDPVGLADLGDVTRIVGEAGKNLQQRIAEQINALGAQVAPEAINRVVDNAVQGAITRMRQANEISALDGEIRSTVDTILGANPALKAVPNIDKILRVEVFKMEPRSKEEMLDGFHQVAAGIVEQLDESYKTARKQTVIDKATMERTGIEPPVGTAPTFTRQIDYRGADGKVDFKKITAAAKASIR